MIIEKEYRGMAYTTKEQNEDFLEEYEESAIIATNKDVANQIIEIFRMNQVCPETLQEVYEDLNTERRKGLD